MYQSEVLKYKNLPYSDGPVVSALTEDVTADNGERIELACLVDSNPGAHITWTRPGQSQVRQLLATKIFRKI